MARYLVILVLFLLLASGGAHGDARLSDSDRAIYQKTFAAVKDDRWAVARNLAATATDKRLAEVVEWTYLRYAAPLPFYRDFLRFIEQHPTWPHLSALRSRMAKKRGKPPIFDFGGSVDELKSRCKRETGHEPPRQPEFQSWAMQALEKPSKGKKGKSRKKAAA